MAVEGESGPDPAVIYFTVTHIMVRRLNTVGWSKWLGYIPVISTLVGIVLLFIRTPEPVPAQDGE